MKRFIIVMLALIAASGLIIHTLSADTEHIEKKEVAKVMKEWNKALGVKCNFCHTKKFGRVPQSLIDHRISHDLIHRPDVGSKVGSHRRSSFDSFPA